MSLTVDGLLAWHPGDLEASAAGLDTARDVMDTSTGEIAGVVRSLQAHWAGEAGDAASAAARRHEATAVQVVETLGLMRRILLGAADAIGAARALLVRAQVEACCHGLTLDQYGDAHPVVDGSPVQPSADADGAELAMFEARAAITVQVEAMAREALNAASEADADAAHGLRAAWSATSHGPGGAVPGDVLVEAVTAREIPGTGTDPRRVAAWWASLSEVERARLVATCPDAIGNLDGVPVAERSTANDVRLTRAMNAVDARITALAAQRAELARRGTASWSGLPSVGADLMAARAQRAMLAAVAAQLDSHPERHLMLLDTTMPGRAAIAIGDVDTADHVAVLVPGMSSHVTNYMDNSVRNACDVQRLGALTLAAEREGRSVATIAWIGYDAPGADVVLTRSATAAVPYLSATLAGIEATRDAVSGPPVHLTLAAHSYGSLVAGLTMRTSTPVDDLVLVGSPGVGAHCVDELHLPAGHVYVGEAQGDFVADLDYFGTDPASRAFGAISFQTDGSIDSDGTMTSTPSIGHSEYYLPGSESLQNIVSVVVGKPGITQGREFADGNPLADLVDDLVR